MFDFQFKMEKENYNCSFKLGSNLSPKNIESVIYQNNKQQIHCIHTQVRIK